MTTSSAPTHYDYGPDPAQFGELYRPEGTARAGTVVVIHGGFWRSVHGLELGRPLARELAGLGWTVWNLEYRRVGSGGGWPATLQDVAAGIDRLAEVPDLDLSRVLTLGHSAGGHLATWAAGRPGLPAGAPGAEPAVAVSAVIAQAGVLDLHRAAAEQVGGTAVPDLLGGSPSSCPERYTVADPARHVPIGVPVRCVHGRADAAVPFSQSAGYVAAARAAGDDAELVEVDADHMALIDVTSTAWARTVELVFELLGP